MAVAALVAAFIAYGSLYPFEFHALPGEAGLLATLDATWRRWPGSRGDLIVNLVLYMPLGLFLALALRRAGMRAPAARLLLATLAGGLLSFAMEVTQLHVDGRTSNLSDLVLNTAGTLTGAIAAQILGMTGWRRADRAALARRHPAEPFAALLVLAWLGYRLYPYAPVIDLHHYWNALKPVLLTPELEPLRTLRLAVLWLVAARLAEAAMLGHGLPARPLLVPALLLGALGAQVLVVDSRLSLAEVLGLGLGLAGWAMLQSERRDRVVAALLALTLAAVLVAERLEPFAFDAAPLRPFGWVPFRAALQGRWEAGMQAMLEKLFLYGGLIWLGVRAGLRLPVTAALVALLLLATSLAQTHLPGRSAEVTDAALALIAGLVFAFLGGGGRSPPATAPQTRWRARRDALRAGAPLS